MAASDGPIKIGRRRKAIGDGGRLRRSNKKRESKMQETTMAGSHVRIKIGRRREARIKKRSERPECSLAAIAVTW